MWDFFQHNKYKNITESIKTTKKYANPNEKEGQDQLYLLLILENKENFPFSISFDC